MLVDHLEDTSYKPYVKRGMDSSTGQNVGILTRIDPTIDLYRTETRVDYPIPGSNCGYTGSPGDTGVSKHYITEYDINGLQIAFIGAHLLAYPTDPSRCVQREAQAQVLQYVISDYIESGYEVIFMGDLNDYDGETLDINSHVPISQTLDILKGLEGAKKGQYELTNVASFVDQNDRYTDWWDSDSNCNTQSVNDYSMIDHILVTQGILSRIKQVYMYHGYNEYCGKIDSDHYPVVMDIDTMYMEY
jgi:exonuclease III